MRRKRRALVAHRWVVTKHRKLFVALISGDTERVRGPKYHQLLANTSDTPSSFVLCDPDAARVKDLRSERTEGSYRRQSGPKRHGADVCVECLYTAVILAYEAGLIDGR